MGLAKDEQASLLEDFIAETAEHLSASEERLLLLEANPSDSSMARQLLRSFHTIKGNSAYFEFRSMAELAHQLESLLTPVQNGEGSLDAAGMQRLLSGVDQLRALLAEVSAGGLDVPGPNSSTQPAVTDEGGPAQEQHLEERYLIFELNGMKMALPLDKVIEVTRAVPVTPLPHVAAHVVGLVNLRGVILPLIDLVQRLWHRPSQSEPEHLVVVPWGRGRLAMAVDRVVSMEPLQADQVSRTGESVVDLPILLHDGEPIVLLDLQATLGCND